MTNRFKRTLFVMAACLLAMSAPTPALAQEDKETMEQQLKEKLQQFLDQMGPALDEALDETMEFFGAFGAIDDPRYYEIPEILPNGDIIIRRRPDAPEYQPPESAPDPDKEGAIDL